MMKVVATAKRRVGDRAERIGLRELLDPLDGLDQDKAILPFATVVGKEKVAAPDFA